MDDTLHLHLTHEELKDLLRRRFARAGLEPPIFGAIDEIALLIRRHGFAAVLERLELAVQELSRPTGPPVDLAEYSRQTEEATEFVRIPLILPMVVADKDLPLGHAWKCVHTIYRGRAACP